MKWAIALTFLSILPAAQSLYWQFKNFGSPSTKDIQVATELRALKAMSVAYLVLVIGIGVCLFGHYR